MLGTTQFLEVVALLERGLRRTFAGDFRAVQGLCGQQLRSQIGIQIVSGVGEGGEDQHLLVAGVDRVSDLLQQERFEVLELGVVLGRDLVHRGQQGVDEFEVALQIALPRRQVHVAEADLDLATDLSGVVVEDRQFVVIAFKVRQNFGQVTHAGRHARLVEGGNLRQGALVITAQGVQGQPE